MLLRANNLQISLQSQENISYDAFLVQKTAHYLPYFSPQCEIMNISAYFLNEVTCFYLLSGSIMHKHWHGPLKLTYVYTYPLKQHFHSGTPEKSPFHKTFLLSRSTTTSLAIKITLQRKILFQTTSNLLSVTLIVSNTCQE